jgi:hypothetical protein
VILSRIPVSEIRLAAYNPRVELQPSDKEYQDLEQSIDRFGLIEPLVWNRTTGNLVSGHQRLKILMARGEVEVDVSAVELPLAEEQALNLVMNKVGGRWDDKKLVDLLDSLNGVVDLNITGFSTDDLEKLTASTALFTPAGLADFTAGGVTDRSVASAQKAHDERFVDPMKRSGTLIRDVTCPHCGQIFGMTETSIKTGDVVSEEEANARL